MYRRMGLPTGIAVSPKPLRIRPRLLTSERFASILQKESTPGRRALRCCQRRPVLGLRHPGDAVVEPYGNRVRKASRGHQKFTTVVSQRSVAN
jgi:hypothetical protein